MHSYKIDGKQWTACCECERGGNGQAENKCSCGGFITKWNKLGCWVGKPKNRKEQDDFNQTGPASLNEIWGGCHNPDCPDWNGEKYDLFRGVSSVSQEDLEERLA